MPPLGVGCKDTFSAPWDREAIPNTNSTAIALESIINLLRDTKMGRNTNRARKVLSLQYRIRGAVGHPLDRASIHRNRLGRKVFFEHVIAIVEEALDVWQPVLVVPVKNSMLHSGIDVDLNRLSHSPQFGEKQLEVEFLERMHVAMADEDRTAESPEPFLRASFDLGCPVTPRIRSETLANLVPLGEHSRKNDRARLPHADRGDLDLGRQLESQASPTACAPDHDTPGIDTGKLLDVLDHRDGVPHGFRRLWVLTPAPVSGLDDHIAFGQEKSGQWLIEHRPLQ